MPNPEVPCHYPMQEDDEPLPEAWDEWRPESGRCHHDYCVEAASFYAAWRAEQPLRESMALMEGDRELIRDEFHVR